MIEWESRKACFCLVFVFGRTNGRTNGRTENGNFQGLKAHKQPKKQHKNEKNDFKRTHKAIKNNLIFIITIWFIDVCLFLSIAFYRVVWAKHFIKTFGTIKCLFRRVNRCYNELKTKLKRVITRFYYLALLSVIRLYCL